MRILIIKLSPSSTAGVVGAADTLAVVEDVCWVPGSLQSQQFLVILLAEVPAVPVRVLTAGSVDVLTVLPALPQTGDQQVLSDGLHLLPAPAPLPQAVHAGELQLDVAHSPGEGEPLLRPPLWPGLEVCCPETVITPHCHSLAGELRSPG